MVFLNSNEESSYGSRLIPKGRTLGRSVSSFLMCLKQSTAPMDSLEDLCTMDAGKLLDLTGQLKNYVVAGSCTWGLPQKIQKTCFLV